MRPGSLLKNRYVIGDCLSVGGSSAVYAAHDTLRNRPSAVKELFVRSLTGGNASGSAVTENKPDPEELEFRRKRILAEVRSGAAFSGERGFTEVTDFFEESGTFYLVTELVKGITLEKYIYTYGKTADREVFLGIAGELLTAADRMREKGIVHRDISPDNIILCTGGENVPPDAGTGLKLIDFGSSANIGTRISAAGNVLKKGFSREETGDTVTSFSDVYSCAAVLYSLLTGNRFNEKGSKPGKRGDWADDFCGVVYDILTSDAGKNKTTLRELASRLGIALPEYEEKKKTFAASNAASPCGALPAGTLLGGRYNVYGECRRNRDCLIYHGFDTALLSDVEITEYYPEYLCSRGSNGSDVTTPAEKSSHFGWGADRFVKKAGEYAAMPGFALLPEVKDLFRDNGTVYLVCGYRQTVRVPDKGKKIGKAETAEICRTVREMHLNGMAHGDLALILRERESGLILPPGLPAALISAESDNFEGVSADDVYSVASMIYSCICGFFPPEVSERLNYICAGRDDPFYFPGRIRRKLGRRSEILRSAFSLRPEERCDAGDLLEIAEALACQG